MRSTTTVTTCLFWLALVTSSAYAEGTIVWAAGYPKTGTEAGHIDLKGTITPDAGWTISSARAEAWEDGKVVVTSAAFLLDINMTTGVGAFEQSFGLTAGKTYNVVVNAVMTDGTITKLIRTKPGVATAKPN